MSKKQKTLKLSEAEKEIMTIIWREEHPLTSNFILEHITSRTLALSTVMTVLARLCEKGFVHCDRTTRTNYYTALISKEDYRGEVSREFLETMHDNSIASMVTALNRKGAITEEDIRELRRILDL
ncbi:MAG: BlaI/MecI/CopY family transcriptional regulator [Peptococcaceae bacterium]|jgi:predicted transcriptional regulator|nr:BlaI/MecI/CopY family transcriptional regulator [Peptococcaceae bacterium]MDR2736070.1 BlaI/MecI/CopY family transcriptional regulator [Gracilibacteraceae bacterium]